MLYKNHSDNMEHLKEKDLSLETLRGIAIILIVIGHVIGSESGGGMQVENDSLLRHFYYTFEYLRMPLFTVISGWVYALHPVKLEYFTGFITKKIRRIIFPMIFVGLFYFLLQYFVPGTNYKGHLSDIWKIFVFPYTLFWYLPSLFLVFTFVALLDSVRIMNTFINWIFIFCFALLALSFRDIIIPMGSLNYFSYKGALYLLPFFIIGIGIKRFNFFFSSPILLNILLPILIICLIIQQLSWYKIIEYGLNRNGGVGLLIGITGAILLLRLRWKVNWLISIGSFAYSIFLFHAFGTAAGRIVIKKFGIHYSLIIFIVSTFAGMYFPIIAEKILDRFKITRMLLLGRSYEKMKKDNNRVNKSENTDEKFLVSLPAKLKLKAT